MSCIQYGFTIEGDVKGRLAKSVDHVAGADYTKAQVLAGYFSTEEFKQYVKDDTGVENYIDVKANTLRRLLNSFFVSRHDSITNSINRKNADTLNGFSSAKAKTIAKDHTANIIIDTYYDEVVKPKNERITNLDIVKEVSKKINRSFSNNVVPNLIARLNSEGIAKESIDKINNINNELNTLFDEYDNIFDVIEANDSGDITALEDRLDEIDEQLSDLENDRYVLHSNLVKEHGNIREKNYGTLVSQVRGNPNAWYTSVFNVSKLINLVDEFNITLESDKLIERNYVDENDVINPNSDTVDEMSKSWEDTLYKSFDRHIGTKLKLYLNRLYKLDRPTKMGDKEYSYDDNNELGVPLTMGSNYIISQISNYASFYSVDDFINSLNKAVQTNPSLYGLSKLVNDMLDDKVFANYVFTEMANPKIAKTISIITETGVTFDQNNKSADVLSHMVYNLLNSAKSTYRDNFNIADREAVKNMTIGLNRAKSNKVFYNSRDIKKYDEFILKMLGKYFPRLDTKSVTAYLYSNPDNIIDNYKNILQDISVLVGAVESSIDDYNEDRGAYNKEYGDWAKKKKIAVETGEIYNVPMPAFDYSGVDFNRLHAPIINLAKKLVNYTAVKNELNSINAEGNMSSDLIGNSYITNFIKQVQLGTEEDINAGLERLKDFVTQSPQYEYSPFFFGVKDSKGNVLSPGLFNKDNSGKITVNPNAKNLISVSLFDGIKDSNNIKSAMYANMSKGDYFLTQLIAFNQPINYITEDDSGAELAGYFMRTPSDAPKNFIVQAPKLSVDGLWRVVNSSRDNYINKLQSDLASKFNFTDVGNNVDASEDIITGVIKGNIKNNHVSANEIYDMFKNPIDNKAYSSLYSKYDNDTNKVSIPLIYDKGDTRMIVWLEGDKVIGTSNNIAENLVIKEIYSPITNDSGGVLSYDFLIDIADVITEDGIQSGDIQRVVDRENVSFRATYSHLLGELNTYVDNLNNVFENKKGVWITKNNVNNLIDRAHYNNGKIVEKGKLSGNLFKFIRLFETNGYKSNEEMSSSLFLYGQANEAGQSPLFIADGASKLRLNTERTDLINIENGNINLNISDANNEILNNIVENWLNNYYSEVIDRTRQYNTILDTMYSTNDIVDYAVNTAIMEMNFDDIFEGDTKFYKDSQDFLKRAKEVQAGGKVYAGFNINDVIGGPIVNTKDINGLETTIDINGLDITVPRMINGTIKNAPLMERNGFRGVTIHNTVRPSKNAANIKKELKNILKDRMSNEAAERISTEIASGYFDTTATNDAQSYITLEEFISRKQLDGTINDYVDLLEQLLDDSIPIESIDLKGINSRIQVQKNFYFDKQFDENTGVYYPRQIKNAEFVLIPKFIKGTDLEKLYNVMRANDIGQVNTLEASKAAKKNTLTFWDNDGIANEEAFNKAITEKNGIAVENYYYRYLYKQQDVADHMVDTKNKAGIQIMKKIIDNANSDVQSDIDNFFSSYVANIKDDFNMLLVRMGWKVQDGALVNADAVINADGKSILRFEEFYKKARVEAQRLGMDSNFIEYLTPDAFGDPAMPNYMNNVSSKLESIAQSIFNNGVTRQTLPGWHAAQVTSVGYGSNVLGEDGTMIDLKYHPEIVNEDGTITQEAYAEVMLPRWSNLIPKDYDISKLAAEGLDIHIGYRIPTEGKQSVSILKVVGFLDSIYGSTIMVPDEWVTQTGSDFDVDSIYGISYEMYKDRNGTIKKVKFDDDTSDRGVQRRYINYINKSIDEKVEKDLLTDEFIQSKVNDLRDSLKDLNVRQDESKVYKGLMDAQSVLYNNLSEENKNVVRAINVQYETGDIVQKYNTIADRFNTISNEEADANTKAELLEFADYNKAIADTISLSRENKSNDYAEYTSAKKEMISKLFEDAHLEYLNKVESVAIEANLTTFEEFNEWSIEEQNSRRARNNRILDSMINIMENDNSREENYSRSNFDDLANSMKKMENLRGGSSIVRSSYNPLDQIDFMENAVSGAQLKAFSVTRDTFNSVSNYVKSRLDDKHAIKIEYDLNKYDRKTIEDSYGEDVTIDTKRNIAIVNHNKFAWSNNNRNVIGKLVTTYSSQTTAHILDAVKEGTIFNENDYTFGTFKTLIDTGVDYDTAIAFLMQPSITRVVDSYFETKSIYTNSSSNPINTAIKRIASDLGITIGGRSITEYTPIRSVINRLSTNGKIQEAYSELFGANLDNRNTLDLHNIGLNGIMLERRLGQAELSNNPKLSKEDKVYRDAAFDLAMIQAFNKIRNTTRNIDEIIRVSNPDKFGAKQTIRSTRRTVNNILEFANNPTSEVAKTLLVDDRSIVNALYPNVGLDGGVNIEQSKYPYLAAFLKFATLPSVEANSQLFATEGKAFNDVTDTVQARLGVYFTDEQYKEYKQYMISNVYSGVSFLTTPLTLNEYGLITLDNDRITDHMEKDTFYWNEERARIFGYDTTQSSSFEVKDINNPTEKDISKFNNLTPAQKVIWIQSNFKDGRGVFEFLDVNTFNQYEFKQKGFTSQSIKYSDQIDDVEEVYVAFRESFFNKNPLVRLAAIDLVKYAFIVEGFKFKKGGISKIITNDAMYSNLEDKGINLIEAIQQQFTIYSNPLETTTQNFIDKFVRSHSEIIREVNIPKAKKDKQGNENIGYKFIRYSQGDGVIYIPFEESASELLEHLTIGENNPKGYVRVSRFISEKNKRTTLYKVSHTNKGIYLAPLNLLERNETSDYSANPRNNIYKAYDYYKALIDTSIDQGVPINEMLKDNSGYNEISVLKEQFTITPHKSKHIVESIENVNELQRILNTGREREQSEVAKFVSDVIDYVNLPVEEVGKYGVVRNDNNYIATIIPANTSVIQNIPNGEDVVTVKITRYGTNKGRSKQFGYVLKGDQRGNINKVPLEERKALANSMEAKSLNPILYKIERVTSEQQREEHEALVRQIEEESADQMSAITNLIEDIDVDVEFDYGSTDKVAKDIFNELYKRSLSNEDKKADKFKKDMDVNGVDRTSAVSINNNRRNIYTAAATYYSQKSHELMSSINTFTGSNGDNFSIDDPALYTHLTEHPEDYPLLIDLILQAKTFGEQFYEIFNLNLVGEDEATSQAIERIKSSINNVRNSSKLKNAVNLLFNDYIANNFSTNPIVRHGLVELKTTFGDTDWFDLTFSDIGELNHKQVQTVVKHVYAILNEATKIIAPKAIDSFTNQYDAIMSRPGEFNENNIITPEGKLIAPYTDKFLEDRQKVIDNLRIAEESYGEDSIQYVKAKLERDKWRAKNIQQEVVSPYYEQDVALRERVLNNAPKEYVEYMRLIHELYSDSRSVNLLTKEERERRRELNAQIRILTSDVRTDGTMKNDEEVFRTNALINYITAKRNLNKEYFEHSESEGFKDTLDYYTTIIKQYEKKHSLETLDQRLNNEDYKEAYDWVHTNTRYTLNEESQTIISDAFKVLKSKDNTTSQEVKKIIRDNDAYDDYGNIDPRKLSPHAIATIRHLTQHKYTWSYDSNAGEAILIKEIPSGLPVLKDSFYRMLRADSENGGDVNRERLDVIGNINKLLSKAVDNNTGQINSKDLFEKLTPEELDTLGSLYRALHNIKGDRNNIEAAKRFKKNVIFKTNDAAFNREWAYAQQNLKNTKQYDTWLSIFIQTDKKGNFITDEQGKFVPNNDIFGYIEPKDKTYVDEAKTNARSVVENDIQFVPTHYYYEALREASDAGKFDEWYNQNHIYNPYTHKMEPLKVWTSMEVTPNGKLNGQYTHTPTYENMERNVKDEYINHNHKKYSTNYNIENGQYNNLTKLSNKEKDMLDLYQNTINAYATTHATRMFADKGFLPRRAKYEPDARWYGEQALGSMGLEFRNTGEKQWSDKLDYTNDFDMDMDMMSLIKRKGYKKPIPIDRKGTYETEEEYSARVEAIRADNKQIEADNLKLDNEILDRDWKSVFQDFIQKGTEYNAKQRVKNSIYLLLEDLKDTPAYKESSWNKNLRKDSARSTVERTEYQTIAQDNTYSLVQNWARRVLFDQFKKNNPYSKYADLMQNITSAKYMIFNVTGGIANVSIGLTNMYGELFARDYFDTNDFLKSQAQYFSNSLTFMSDMYKDTTNNLTVGLTKLFDVIDFDAFTERRPNEKATEQVRRIRDSMYGLQSGGEHYMQNVALLSILKSHRLYKDTDGTMRVGSIQNYNWEVEIQTLMGLLNGKEDLLIKYKSFIKDVKSDLNELRKYDTFARDFNEEFLREIGDKNLINEYIVERKKALVLAKEEFLKNPTAEEQFELVDGRAVIKEDSAMNGIMFGELRQKVISVNKKIHGVYDKIGAASIEKEWWGGLVMQYHKHIYPGIMKRYRTKGYYNEIRGSIEQGSYISLAKYLATEFRDIKKSVNRRVEVDNENVALASIREVVKASIDTILNLKMNYNLMPVWEQNNMKRSLGDLMGVASAFLVAIGLHLMTDDDDIKESELLSTVIYMADRLNSESSMYTPFGLYSEAGTLWSSPIAAQNGPKDLMKGLGIGVSVLFDDDYNINYTTGIYKGQNKAAVLLYRNTPIYRVYQRLSTMTKNNNYYRINDNAINIKTARSIADAINPD